MKYCDWDEEKNEWLKEERSVSFEDVVIALDQDGELDRIDHPDPKKYPNQKILIIKIENYAFLVPYVEDEEKVFFKTIIPSRKATKKYLAGKKEVE